ncbi:MAG TPA: M23 family metallopeptidase [Methylovirgula sp.]|nr:M23 family metallopeptidase [Methylovirgula sp.]
MISPRSKVGPRRDHLRLTFAYRSFSKTLALPRPLAAALLLVLPFIAAIYLAATCYFLFHDELLASLTRHQVELQYAYEERIATLRHELEKATEQARIDEADFTDQVRALGARQDLVESRTALIASLAARMKDPRGPAPDQSAPAPASAETPLPDHAPADGKPHPEDLDLELRKSSSAAFMSPVEAQTSLPLPEQIHLLVDRYDRVDREHLAILGQLQMPANLEADHIRTTLASAGLSADRLKPPIVRQSGGATGGPFVALPILSDGSSFALAAGRLESAIDSVERLRRVLSSVPLELPLSGEIAITSPFGPRIDPFLGRPALHTGVDLLGTYGAPVHATAAGIVVSAGYDGGYGNMVEVDHGNGLATRYAHLSSIEVAPGQKVSYGTVLGRIGETGRATGPHLHYEVRIDGQPVDPERFFKAGTALIADAGARP